MQPDQATSDAKVIWGAINGYCDSLDIRTFLLSKYFGDTRTEGGLIRVIQNGNESFLCNEPN